MDAIGQVIDMVKEAEDFADHQSKDRLRAVQYYQGKMEDTPSEVGRSSITTRDVRSTIKKVLPSIVRTILGNEQVVEFQPVSQGDEAGAEQATDYINYVVMPETDGRQVIEDAIHDALLLRNGIIKWWWEEKKTSRVSSHSGLTDDQLAELVNDDAVEVLEHTEAPELIDGQPITLHDLRIKRIITEKGAKAAAVPRERFLIHPDAVSLDDSVLVGEKCKLRRSDLVAMGYEFDAVMALSQEDGDDDIETDARRDAPEESDETHKPNELIDYYDVYVRFDEDGDGIAELWHMAFGGTLSEKNLLLKEEADEVQFADIKVMRQPHQWEGISVFDDTADIQRVTTVLTRQTLDNLYWQNNPQPIMQDGAVTNPEAVMNPEFGLPIKVKQGYDVRSALGFNQVPFVARESFAMLEYMDRQLEDRTGITDASAGLAPDALQNVTAKASAMMEQAGIGQTELMVRTAAVGLRRFFLGMLKLIIKHQDVARTIRLRDQWVNFDPRQWNAMMDCTINVGLGAGTRERDLAVVANVFGLQEKMFAAFGPDNPFVKPDNVWNTLSKMVQAAGLQSPEMFFTQPDPQEIAAKLEAQKNQPSPEMMKVQAQQAEAQAKLQLEQQKLQGDMQIAREKMQAEFQLSREKMDAEFQLKREQMAAEAVLKASQPTQPSMQGVRFGGAVG